MVTLETVLQVVPVVSLVIVGAYYSLQIRNQNRTRQAQLFMQAYSTFIDREFQKSFFEIVRQWKRDDYDDFWQKYGPDTNSEEASKWGSVLAYFEGLGVFVEQGLIDIELVSRMGSGNIIVCWEKFGPVFEEYTQRTGSPYHYEYMGWLYNELKTKRHIPPDVFKDK